jgi:hypothetical protein
MLDNIIKLIFSWEKLRLAVFAEVDWYNSITRTLNDPDSMKTASAFGVKKMDGVAGALKMMAHIIFTMYQKNTLVIYLI